MIDPISITLSVPAEKRHHTESLFRRWQDACRRAGLTEPAWYLHQQEHIAPSPYNDTHRLLQVVYRIEAWPPMLSSCPVIRRAPARHICAKCHHAGPKGAGWEVRNAGKTETYCDPCAIAENPDIHRHNEVLRSGLRAFAYPERWATVFEAEEKRQQAGQYICTSGYLHLAEQFTEREGFKKSNQPDATRDQIVVALKESDNPRYAWVTGIADAIHYRTDDARRQHYLAAFAGVDSDDDSHYVKLAREALSRPFLDLGNTVHTGVLASLPSAAKRQQGSAPSGVNKTVSGPVGNPKERGTLLLTLTHHRAIKNRQFPTTAYYFIDNQHRHYEWYASDSVTVDVEPGEVTLLTATIKKHRQHHDGTTVTVLTRCADFIPASVQTPEPDFTSGVKARAFRENVQCHIHPYDDRHHIDGRCHLHFLREWKQSGRIYSHTTCHAVTDIPAITDLLQAQMSELTGQSESAKKAARWTSAVKEALSPYLDPQVIPDKLYVVDSATESFLAPEPKQGIAPLAPEQQILEPVMFTSLATATDYARRYVFSRITTLHWPHPKVRLLPGGAKKISQEQHQALCQHAKKQGVDLLAYYNTSHTHITRLLPLSLYDKRTEGGISVLQQSLGAYRRAPQLDNKLNKLSLLAITGCRTRDEFLSRLATLKAGAEILHSHQIDTRWLLTATTPAGLQDTAQLPHSSDKPVLVIMDDTTACAIAQMGASIKQYHVSDTPSTAMVKKAKRLSVAQFSVRQII